MNTESQIEFALTGNGGSQCDRIEAVLRSRIGEWVPMPELWRASGAMAVHSRISDLRKRGLDIEHRNEVAAGRVTHSFYRLVTPEQAAQRDAAVAQDLADEFSQR